MWCRRLRQLWRIQPVRHRGGDNYTTTLWSPSWAHGSWSCKSRAGSRGCCRSEKSSKWNEETVEWRRSIPYKKRFDWLFRSTYIPLRAPEFHELQRNYTEQRHAISKKTSDTYFPYHYVIIHATTSGPFSSKFCPKVSSKPVWHRSPGALS